MTAIGRCRLLDDIDESPAMIDSFHVLHSQDRDV